MIRMHQQYDVSVDKFKQVIGLDNTEYRINKVD